MRCTPPYPPSWEPIQPKRTGGHETGLASLLPDQRPPGSRSDSLWAQTSQPSPPGSGRQPGRQRRQSRRQETGAGSRAGGGRRRRWGGRRGGRDWTCPDHAAGRRGPSPPETSILRSGAGKLPSMRGRCQHWVVARRTMIRSRRNSCGRSYNPRVHLGSFASIAGTSCRVVAARLGWPSGRRRVGIGVRIRVAVAADAAHGVHALLPA
jgi:hypothetical protein